MIGSDRAKFDRYPQWRPVIRGNQNNGTQPGETQSRMAFFRASGRGGLGAKTWKAVTQNWAPSMPPGFHLVT